MRHSNSFAQPVEREELEKIEYLLESCNKDGEISVYLTQCFNHPSVSYILNLRWYIMCIYFSLYLDIRRFVISMIF